MAFGKTFKTLKEANARQKWDFKRGRITQVRKMIKTPRRKKLYHVGTKIDFLNFT